MTTRQCGSFFQDSPEPVKPCEVNVSRTTPWRGEVISTFTAPRHDAWSPSVPKSFPVTAHRASCGAAWAEPASTALAPIRAATEAASTPAARTFLRTLISTFFLVVQLRWRYRDRQHGACTERYFARACRKMSIDQGARYLASRPSTAPCGEDTTTYYRIRVRSTRLRYVV